MHSNLNIWLISLLGVCLSAPAQAQTTTPATSPTASSNTAAFHEAKLLESAPQAPAPLRQLAAKLSGRLVGHAPNVSIEFILMLQNNGPQEVKIADPLDIFYLQFTTAKGKLIPMPKRLPKFLIKVGRPKGMSADAIAAMRRNAPYPAPVQFRQIVRLNGPSSQKEETITIPPGTWIQLVVESEPVVMQRVMEALRTETGEAAKSFKYEQPRLWVPLLHSRGSVVAC